MNKEELFKPSSYFRFDDISDNEAWLYYNLLVNTEEIHDSKFIECKFSKIEDIINFNALISKENELRCLKGYIVESYPKFSINTKVTKVLTNSRKREYEIREILETNDGEIINLGKEKVKIKRRRLK